MDALERDYPSALLATHAPPCLSLYQPTHRQHPEKRQDPIRFRNLIKRMEASLRQKYAGREIMPLLAPFENLASNREFWNHALDGLAVLATSDLFRIYRLQRPVRELAVVADSFHTKPLMRIVQSADRYQVLGISRERVRLFEGNRDALDEIDPASGVPRSITEVLGSKSGEPERQNRVYGPAQPGATTRHGTDVREDEQANEIERFFRAVDRAVLDHHSRPSGMALLLAALAENQARFRAVSRNPFLAAEPIQIDPDALSADELRARVWQLVQPHYVARLQSLVERFRAAESNGLGADDLAQIAAAATAGRIAVLLVEADREVPGRFDAASGTITLDRLDDPEVDDLLDDVAEHVLRSGSDVVIVPAERMPTRTGLAAVYRF